MSYVCILIKPELFIKYLIVILSTIFVKKNENKINIFIERNKKKLQVVIFLIYLILLSFCILSTQVVSAKYSNYVGGFLGILKLLSFIMTIYALVFSLSKNTLLEIKASVLFSIKRNKAIKLFILLSMLYYLSYLSIFIFNYTLSYYILELLLIINMIYLIIIFFIDHYMYDKNDVTAIFNNNSREKVIEKVLNSVDEGTKFSEKKLFLVKKIDLLSADTQNKLLKIYSIKDTNKLIDTLMLDLYLKKIRNKNYDDTIYYINKLYKNNEYEIISEKLLEMLENRNKFENIPKYVYELENKIFTNEIEDINIDYIDKQMSYCNYRNNYILKNISDKRIYYEYLVNYIILYLSDFRNNLYVQTFFELLNDEMITYSEKKEILICVFRRLEKCNKYIIDENDNIRSNNSQTKNILFTSADLEFSIDIYNENNSIKKIIEDVKRELNFDYLKNPNNLHRNSIPILNTYLGVSDNNNWYTHIHENHVKCSIYNQNYTCFVKKIESELTKFYNYLKKNYEYNLNKLEKNLSIISEFNYKNIIGQNINKRQYYCLLFDENLLKVYFKHDYNSIEVVLEEALDKIEVERKKYIQSIEQLSLDVEHIKTLEIEYENFKHDINNQNDNVRRFFNLITKEIIEPDKLKDKYKIFSELSEKNDPLKDAFSDFVSNAEEYNKNAIILISYFINKNNKRRKVLSSEKIPDLGRILDIIYCSDNIEKIKNQIFSEETPEFHKETLSYNLISSFEYRSEFEKLLEDSNKQYTTDGYFKCQFDFYKKSVKYNGTNNSLIGLYTYRLSLSAFKNDNYNEYVEFIEKNREKLNNLSENIFKRQF